RIPVHGLVIQNRYVANHAIGEVKHRNAQIALGIQIYKACIKGKQLLKSFPIVANLSLQDFHARRACNIKLETLSETVTVPESERLCMFLIVTVRYESVTNAESRSQVTHESWKELTTSGRGRSDDNGSKGLFGKVPLCDVTD